MGDIAIAAPVVRATALSNPDTIFTMVSRPYIEPLFAGIPNLRFYPADFTGKLKGIPGLVRLFLSLKKLNPTHIADLHNVTRTWILRTLFFFSLIPVRYMKKDRKERKLLTRRENKILKPLTPVYEKYLSVLERTGVAVPEKELIIHDGGIRKTFKGSSAQRRGERLIKIGIAPFAKHKAKMWPLERMEQVISILSKNPGIKIFLFGGGGKETAMLLALEQKYSSVESMAGRHSLSRELEIMEELDLLLTMDSANMHLASFTSIPVISIWGATHPFAGFYGLGQPQEYAVQVPLECRPCSVYGSKKCYRKDYACLMNINVSDVLQRVEGLIQKIKDDER